MFGSKSSGDKWPIKYLSEIVDPNCPISYGIVQPGDELEDGVPIVRPVDLNSNYYVYKNGLKRTTEAISNSYKRTILRGDELLLCVRGTTGVMGLATEELKGGNVTRGITPLYFKEGFNRIYLLGAFLSDDVQAYIKDNTVGSTLKGINMERVRKIQIPIPPIEIQNKWEEVFKQADKSKFMRSKSQFIEMFGNPIGAEQKYSIKPLGDCCIINPRRPSIDLSDSDKVSFVPMPSVSEEGGLLDIVDEEYGIVKKGFTYFEDDDVLFAKITPCMENGKGAIAHSLTNGVGMGSTEFHVLRPIEGVSNPYWLLALTRLPLFRKDASKNMKGTGGQKRVGTDYLQNFKVGLPPIEKQIEFEQIYKQADKSKLICLLWNHCHCRDVYTK